MENLIPVLAVLLAVGILILAIVQLVRNLDSDQSGIISKMNDVKGDMVSIKLYDESQKELHIRLERLEEMIEPQRQRDVEVDATLKSLNRDVIEVARRVSEIPRATPAPRPIKIPKTIQVEVAHTYPEEAPVVRPKKPTVLQEVTAKKKKK